MIWCIKTYIIAYVKTQKNKIHLDFYRIVNTAKATHNKMFLLSLLEP